MGITPFEIYLIMQLNSLCGLLLVLCVVTGGVSAGSFIEFLSVFTTEEKRTLLKKVLKISVPLSIMSLLLFVFIPSSKTVAAMYIVPKIVNNENAQKLPDEMLQLFRESIKDMLPEKGKES